jgi:hypothetical protein
MRAHYYATADRYLRLAEAEPTVTNPDALRVAAYPGRPVREHGAADGQPRPSFIWPKHGGLGGMGIGWIVHPMREARNMKLLRALSNRPAS